MKDASSHRSHIPSSYAKARGWSRVPSADVRAETYSLGKEVGTEFMSGQYLSLTDTCTTSGGDFNTSGYYYPPNQTWVTPWYDAGSATGIVTIKEIIKEREVTKEVSKRTLFKVYVVDPRRAGKILSESAVIAENENQAMLKAGVIETAAKEGLELEQVDVYVQCIGTFIRPRKETQRVKITKNEEE